MNIAETAAIVNALNAGGGGGGSSSDGGYDIVLDCGEGFDSSLDNWIISWDYAKVKAKVRNGERVQGVAFRHFNYSDSVDGDTSIEALPMDFINIYATSADMFFREAVPTNFSGNNVYIYLARLRVEFDPETGELTARTFSASNKTLT